MLLHLMEIFLVFALYSCGLIVFLARQDVQFGEFQFARELSSQLTVDRVQVFAPDTGLMPEVNEDWHA